MMSVGQNMVEGLKAMNAAIRAKILVYGAGGHGAVIANLLLEIGYGPEDLYLCDDDPERTQLDLGPETLAVWHDYPSQPVGELQTFLVAVGDNETRRAIATTLRRNGYRGRSHKHPSAVGGRIMGCGDNTVVCAGAHVGPNVFLGQDVIINTHADVEHDAVIGAGTHVGPHAVVCGGAVIGPRVLLGAGSIVLPGVTVPDGVTVGAGAVVTRETRFGTGTNGQAAVVVGVPAKAKKSGVRRQKSGVRGRK
jgi:sugar O-acyltransferase (sialic acid O-acetyltransferase NeuD family)